MASLSPAGSWHAASGLVCVQPGGEEDPGTAVWEEATDRSRHRRNRPASTQFLRRGIIHQHSFIHSTNVYYGKPGTVLGTGVRSREIRPPREGSGPQPCGASNILMGKRGMKEINSESNTVRSCCCTDGKCDKGVHTHPV